MGIRTETDEMRKRNGITHGEEEEEEKKKDKKKRKE